MTNESRTMEPWSGKKAQPRAGYYEYKNVRFKLSRSTQPNSGWHFQPFGREPQVFATWEDAVIGLEETCNTIAQQRAERRNRG